VSDKKVRLSSKARKTKAKTSCMNYGWETKTTVFEEKKEKKISPPLPFHSFLKPSYPRH
jgi:hypothetical protein